MKMNVPSSFKIAPNWKQPKYPPTHEVVQIVVYSLNEMLLIIKENKLLIYKTT